MVTSVITLINNVTTKIGRLTDSTDYNDYGIDVETLPVVGLGVIKYNGEIIVSKLNPSDPLIDLSSGDTFFEFDLELDSTGDVANGTYEVEYFVNVSILQPNQIDFGVLSSTELLTDGSSWLANFLVAGNQLLLDDNTTVTVVSATNVSGNVLIVIEEEVLDTQGYFNINISNETFSDVYSQKDCEFATGCIGFTYDCEYGVNGTWSVTNATQLVAGQSVSSLNATISYFDGTQSQTITTTTLPYSSNTLYKGSYSVVLTQLINQVQPDGLIIQYTLSTTTVFPISCGLSICGLLKCFENLRAAHAAALAASKVSQYQFYFDNAVAYIELYKNYLTCGNAKDAKLALEALQATLDASNCGCDCGCDDETFGLVQNVPSTVMNQIEQILQSLQWTPYDGVPSTGQDSSLGYFVNQILLDSNTGIAYIATDVTVGAAVWEVYYDPSLSNQYVESVTGNVVDNTDPYNPIVTALESLTGDGVDNTDPQNPVLSWPNLIYYFSVTKSQFDTLQANSELVVGAFYRITGFLTSALFDRSWNVLAIANSPNTIQTQGWVMTRTLTIVGLDPQMPSIDFLEAIPEDVRLSAAQVLDWNTEIVTSNQELRVLIELANGQVLMTYCADDVSVLRLTNVQNLFTGQFGTYDPNTDVFTPNPIVESVTGTAVDNTDPANPIVNSSGGSSSLVYAAKINQAGTGAPSATVLYNDTTETFSFAYVDVGVYSMTCSSSILADAVVFINGTSAGTTYNAGIISGDTILITTQDAGVAANGRLSSASLKIEVYS
jgi:hypothetical protein